MTTLNLNLVYPSNSDINYKISQFPDGQQDVTILSSVNPNFPIYNGISTDEIKNHEVRISSRFNSFKDLELIVASTKALRRLGVKTIHLYIPYLLGARSDRQFVNGGTSYLVDVIAPIINAQGYESVTVIDVHSDVAPACINNLKMIDNTDLVKYFFDYMVEKNDGRWVQPLVVSPDAGSLKKIYNVTKKVGITTDVIVCSKYRDTDGKLSKTHVPLGVHDANKDLVIIDDIGDGFGTFINIFDTIEQVSSLSSSVHQSQYGKLYLIITHSIQENGLKRALEKFNYVFTTNSINDWKHENLIVMNVF
jgi:ribose-phosphate pyrophosphokinase